MNTLKTILIAIFICWLQFAYSQKIERPTIGTSPDFKIRNVLDKKDSVLEFSELKGKPVILCFWSTLCWAAPRSFQNTERIYRLYKDKITFLLIGMEEEQKVKRLFATAMEKMKLSIPYAFDTILKKQFVPNIAPHFTWIDKNGIVRAVTSHESDLNESNIESFLIGEDFSFYDYSFAAIEKRESEEIPFDIYKPFLVNGNGGTSENFISRSILIPYEPGKLNFGGFPPDINLQLQISNRPKSLFQGVSTLKDLYFYSYTGYQSLFYTDSLYSKIFPHPIIQLRDSSKFEVDWELKKGYYWYSLIIDSLLMNREHILESMRNDLKKSFGYNVKIETRKMPCWVITASRKARRILKTKGGFGYDDRIEPAEVLLTNVTMTHAMSSIFHMQFYDNIPFIDETKIRNNIDIYINANKFDFEDIKKELEKLGLKLRQVNRKMKVMIISE